MNPPENWKDTWKLAAEGHEAVWSLHRRLRQEMKDRWKRAVPFADELFDRWERAAFLGFGPEASIYDSSLVLGDVQVGEGTWIGPFTVLDGRGGLTIGRYCSISAGVQVYSHDTVKWALTGGTAPEERQPTHIGDCCYIGPMAIVSRGVTIGEHSVVGANSFVRADVPPFGIVVGTPARVIGRVELAGDNDVRFVYQKEQASMADRKLISVVVPVFNEETNIHPFYQALTGAMAKADVDFELLLVDDGSTDRTFALISELAGQDSRVKSLRFSRNFGSHAALTAGLRHTRGDAAVIISVDLQDNPELINTFVKHWREGYHVVWGVRESRDDPWAKKTLARLFYAFIRRIALPDYPAQGMDFGLIDRKVIDAFNHFEEASRIVPTMIVWAGFRQTLIPYHRAARHSGVSKWPLRKRIKAAIDITVSFSYLPIRLMSYLGMVVSLLGFAYGAFLIIGHLFFNIGAAGWPSLMVAVLFLGGLQLMMLGVLGEYIWRTSEQVRRRPLYIVMEQVGLHRTERGVAVHEENPSELHRVPG